MGLPSVRFFLLEYGTAISVTVVTFVAIGLLFLFFNRIKEPPALPPTNYEAIVKYLISVGEANRWYQTFVCLSGVVGMLFTIAFITSVALRSDYYLVDTVGLFPGLLGSGITTAFGYMEGEAKKKKCYRKLDEVARLHKAWNDEERLVAAYKEWTWQELLHHSK
ncbi:MAG TPA: hypothetical protein VEY71_03460 [Chitinophagales bacterium]|nr:hypothetical protein [Chitinophagales bacterium]